MNNNSLIYLGLKLWSINKNYVNEAKSLFEKGYCKYIELYVVPGSYNEYIKLWKGLNIPFVIHAPHYREGMNLANKANEKQNFKLVEETKKYADALNAEIMIFHPGIAGDTEETARQIKKINDKRVVVENKPYFALDDNLICNGYSPHEIKRIIDYSGVGFCLDIGHAICTANAFKTDIKEYLEYFISLNPRMFHLSDGDYSGVYDSHLHFGDGSFNINFLLSKLPEKSLVTIETIKNSSENLNDFIQDIEYIKNKCFVIKLADENDLIDVYNLSNDTVVRNNSFNSETILFENHIKWYKNKINSLNSVFYIIRNIDQSFIGQVRFEKESNNNWIISISISDKYRGGGLGSKILKESINKFFENHSPSKIFAYIKKNNESSLKSFSKSLFSIVSEEIINNIESYKLMYINEF